MTMSREKASTSERPQVPSPPTAAGTVCVVGLGYVGLTLGLILANLGVRVIGVDLDESTVRRLSNGEPTIHEKGLDLLLRKTIGRTFFVHSEIPPGEASTFIICVASPIDPSTKRTILDPVTRATTTVADVLRPGNLVVVRSSIPVGTTRETIVPLLEARSGLRAGRDFYLAHAPERTTEGRALVELRELAQVVGGLDRESVRRAGELFHILTPTILTTSSLEAAEMIKFLDNTYRDLQFAYANQIALACEVLGLDALEVIDKANFGYPRNAIPLPSPGVGGSCLAKDPHIFVEFMRARSFDPTLTRAARELNESLPAHIVDRVERLYREAGGDTISARRAFVAGFAFKGHPETGDLRNSTTLTVVELLKGRGCTVTGFDPIVPGHELKELGVDPATVEEGFERADLTLVLNNHRSFADWDIGRLAGSMNRPGVLYDGWRFFDREDVEAEGIAYGGTGL